MVLMRTGSVEKTYKVRNKQWMLNMTPGFFGDDWLLAPPIPMSYIAWNCFGLGNPCTVQELFRLVREQDPLVLFVVETGLDEARLEVLRCKLHFSSKVVVSRWEQGGGLTLFRKQEANVTIKSYSLYHIDTVINEGKDDAWRFIGFYGAPETHRRTYLGLFFNPFTKNFHFHGFVWEILMNSLVWMKSLAAQWDPIDRCKILEMPLMSVAL